VEARYTYGDSQLAGDRLALVSRLFEPTSASFLGTVVTEAPDLALDLGCGPGATTALVRDATGARHTVGLDRSLAFARRAHASTGLGFVVADVVTSAPPIRPAALIYSRLLVAHVREPATVIARWATALAPGGRVLVDDLESIDAEGVFRMYLDDVALEVVRAQGGTLLVGPVLHRDPDPPGLARVYDEVASVAPTAAETAQVFAMNLRVLSANGEVEPRPDIASELEAVAAGTRPSAPVRWRFRQIAWEKTG
jgi:trans-aconitate 2-methyltransferase